MGPNIIYLAVPLFFLVFLSAIFSLCEAAFLSVQEEKIFTLKKGGLKSAQTVLKLIQNREQIVSLSLLCDNIVNIMATSLSTIIFARVFHNNEGISMVFSTVFMTIVIFIFGEVVPKTIGLRQSVAVTIYFANFISLLLKLLKPALYFIDLISAGVNKNVVNQNQNEDAGDSIMGAVEMYHQKGTLENQEKKMLSGVLSLDNIDVKDVMIHRKDLFAINILDDIEEIYTKIKSSPFARIPFYEENDDNMIGVLVVKDFFIAMQEYKDTEIDKEMIKKLLQTPTFIPAEASLISQIEVFKNNGNILTFVVDEYGGIMGILTIQDIIEQIIGDIKHGNTKDEIVDIKTVEEGTFIVHARVNLKHLNEEIGTTFNDNEVSSLGGFLINKIERIPHVNEEFEINNCHLTVLETNANKVVYIKIVKNNINHENEE